MAHDFYPLRTVSQLTGLSADVIRTWERRYGVVKPDRGPRGARLYGSQDVEHLRLLRRAVESGRAIGDVAGLSEADLRTLVDGEVPASDGTGSETRGLHDEVIAKTLDAVKRFELESLERDLGHALVALGSTEFVRNLAAPLLHEVGTRWEAGRISIAAEHFVASVLRNLLGALLRARRPARDGVVLLATPSGERHELGILLAAMIIADAGFNLCYLGADLPPNEIVEAAMHSRALAAGIGLVNSSNRVEAARSVETIEQSLPTDTEIWLGGTDASAVAARLGSTRALVIPDPQTMDSEIRRLRTRAALARTP